MLVLVLVVVLFLPSVWEDTDVSTIDDDSPKNRRNPMRTSDDNNRNKNATDFLED